MEPCDLEELIERSLKTFSFRVQQDNITIDFHRPIQHLPNVHLDPGAITQAFSNLVDNAIKYANGSKHIEIKLYREQNKAVIAVKDQGIGIAADEIDKIFDRFHRVGTGLVHDVKGNGLGLAIVKHIMEAHRGQVRVESELNAGSTFSLCLPLDKEEPETSPETFPYTSPRIEET
jgi:two-component system phosphate regulon sensor histidine kinase PhoR